MDGGGEKKGKKEKSMEEKSLVGKMERKTSEKTCERKNGKTSPPFLLPPPLYLCGE